VVKLASTKLGGELKWLDVESHRLSCGSSRFVCERR
jgi:hypothetical protein